MRSEVPARVGVSFARHTQDKYKKGVELTLAEREVDSKQSMWRRVHQSDQGQPSCCKEKRTFKPL